MEWVSGRDKKQKREKSVKFGVVNTIFKNFVNMFTKLPILFTISNFVYKIGQFVNKMEGVRE